MIRRTARYFWSVRRQFGKYLIVGGTSFLFDMGLLIFLKEKARLTPTTAVVIDQALVLIYNFLLNKYWSFRSTILPHKQVVRYASLMAVNFLFSVLLMYLFNHVAGFDYRLVRLGSITIMVSWNFLLYKYWVYT